MPHLNLDPVEIRLSLLTTYYHGEQSGNDWKMVHYRFVAMYKSSKIQ
jgi:hypothetical protein